MEEYQQKLKELRRKLIDAYTAYVMAEEDVYNQGKGFVDLSYMEQVFKAKQNWQSISNEFYSTLSTLAKQKSK
jgi:hypothetical protein